MNFKPRVFKAKIDEFGLDDYGVASGTYQVQSLTKDKIYEERNPDYIQGHRKGVVIDDNSCWWIYGTKAFDERFEEVKGVDYKDV